jgi:hypothetical protein
LQSSERVRAFCTACILYASVNFTFIFITSNGN